MENKGAKNTDREIWREREGDYYANSIHVTAQGHIGINVGGYVVVKSIEDWHASARERDRLLGQLGDAYATLAGNIAELAGRRQLMNAEYDNRAKEGE